MNEIWKDVIGYEGLYQVSNFGNVRSFKNLNGIGLVLKPHPIKPLLKRDGYLSVTLSKKDNNGRRIVSYPRINQLVARAFIENPDNLPCVDHKDNNKLNNCVDNLQWISSVDNIRKYFSSNHHNKWKGRGKINAVPVYQLDYEGNIIKKYKSMTEAAIQVYGDKSFRTKICKRCERGTPLHNFYWKKVEGGDE